MVPFSIASQIENWVRLNSPHMAIKKLLAIRLLACIIGDLVYQFLFLGVSAVIGTEAVSSDLGQFVTVSVNFFLCSFIYMKF